MRKILFALAVLIVLSPLSASAASLTYGSSGSAVVALQQALIAKGYLAAGKATGYFGSLTLAALKKFQCDSGIICSSTAAVGYGVYGPRTQAALGASGGTTGGTVTPPTVTGFEYSGWIPYWREDNGVKDALAHVDQLQEINPFVYVLQSDGTIQDMAGVADEPWASLRTVAKAKKVRYIPTIMTGSADTIHNLLSDPTSRVQLEEDIVALVNREGFDGIDIDFEGKRAEDRVYFSTFLKGLYQRMGTKWVMCTIESRTPLSDLYYNTTPPAGAGIYANDFVEINKYCDRVRFMTYDQQTVDLKRAAEAAAQNKLYAPVADVVWVEKAMREALKTIPARKVVMGVATYGYEWDVTAYADGYQYDLLWSFGPGYATPIAAAQGITPTRQFSGEIGFSYTPVGGLNSAPQGQVDLSAHAPAGTSSGDQTAAGALAAAQANNTNHSFRYMVWQDAEAIRQKIDLAKQLGIRGVAVFRIDGGEDAGMWQYFK
jgi:spore germination protein YaaH